MIAQPIVAGSSVIVNFPNEIFDLNNEYDPATLIFTPTQSGVYSICANVGLLPTNPAINHATELSIQVNGIAQVVSSNFYIGGLPLTRNSDSACTIVQLQPGDTVRVVFLVLYQELFKIQDKLQTLKQQGFLHRK